MAAQLIDGPSYLDPKVIKIQEFRDYIVSAQDGWYRTHLPHLLHCILFTPKHKVYITYLLLQPSAILRFDSVDLYSIVQAIDLWRM